MSELTRKQLPIGYDNEKGLCAECYYHMMGDTACGKPISQMDCSDSGREYIFIKLEKGE